MDLDSISSTVSIDSSNEEKLALANEYKNDSQNEDEISEFKGSSLIQPKNAFIVIFQESSVTNTTLIEIYLSEFCILVQVTDVEYDVLDDFVTVTFYASGLDAHLLEKQGGLTVFKINDNSLHSEAGVS